MMKLNDNRGELGGFSQKVGEIYAAMNDLLVWKNAKYGNSALSPLKIFSKIDAQNSICVRLDDKLNRIRNAEGTPELNDVLDVMGYLTLYLVSNGVTADDIKKFKEA